MERITTGALAIAEGKIKSAQRDLHRQLSDGERRDLLMDNTKWDSDYIKRVVALLSSQCRFERNPNG